MNRENHADQLSHHSALLLLAFLLGFASVVEPSLAQLPCGYNVTEIITTPPCGIFQSSPTVGAISPNGELVVGTYSCLGGDERGFIYRPATNQFSTMPMPLGISSLWAFDVTDAGLVAGSMDGVGIGLRGYIYDLNSGQYVTQIPPLVSGGQSAITGINAAGWACGYRTIKEPAVDIVNAAFVLSPEGTIIDLGIMNGPRSASTDITENNIVVGWTGATVISNGTRAFVWQYGKTTILEAIPNGLSSAALAANEIPQVLLWGRLEPQPGSPAHAYVWENGRMTDMGILPGFESLSATSINNSSIVVGICSGAQSPAGYVWFAGVIHPLSKLVSDAAGLSRLGGLRINDLGQILGQARTSTQQNVAFVASPANRTPGDTNCDQFVNIHDLLEVVSTWGPCQGCITEFTGDGTVNVLDLLFVIENWTVF